METFLSIIEKPTKTDVLSNDLREKIRSITKEITYRLKNTEEVNKHIGTGSIPNLANGLPGLCLLFAKLDNIDPTGGWDLIGHDYLIKTKEAIESTEMDLSLWYGLSGVGMAARALSRSGERYTNFINYINKSLLDNLPPFINYCFENMERNLSVNHYDLSSGLAGICRYLLIYSHDHETRRIIHSILEYFIILSKEKSIEGQKVHGWYVPQENFLLESEKEIFKKGSVNFGVSHGIAGPLSILSIAKLKGIELPGQEYAINDITNSILHWKIDNEFGGIWPRVISYEEIKEGRFLSEQTHFDGWCYGIPGSARAVWLAGNATGNEVIKEEAINSLLGLFRKSNESKDDLFSSPSFCHGITGALYVYNQMYQETGMNEFKLMVLYLLDKVFHMYDQELVFCYRNTEKGDYGINEGNLPGLVNGAVGITLCLLGLIDISNNEWDASFVLS